MEGSARFNFTDRTVLITGGATGIGAAISAAFLEAGANVVIGARRRQPMEDFCARYPRASYIEMDVGNADARAHAIDTVLERHGTLDVLINNAMAYSGGPLDGHSLEEIEAMYRILLVAPTALIQRALPVLRDSRGCVINISSVVGRSVPEPPLLNSVYSAGKGGLSHLTKVLASELGRSGIRVNAIAPGATETVPGTYVGAFAERLVSHTPLGRIGTPADISGAALFLASDAASWITGQVLDVSGGWEIGS